MNWGAPDEIDDGGITKGCGLPTMLSRRTAMRKYTHSETAHNKGCRCALYILNFAVFEVKAHLNGIRSRQLVTH